MYALGERIRTLREQCGLTQEQLGEMLGVTKAAVSSYELGVATPPSQRLQRIAGILHTTPAYLMNRDEPRTVDVSNLTESQEAVLRQMINEFTKANEK